jgi:hypothetical protein
MKYYTDNIELENTCVGVTESEWNELMKGATKANGAKIRQMIKKQLPALYNALSLNLWNPYESHAKKTKTHYIYVSSMTEYFLKRY